MSAKSCRRSPAPSAPVNSIHARCPHDALRCDRAVARAHPWCRRRRRPRRRVAGPEATTRWSAVRRTLHSRSAATGSETVGNGHRRSDAVSARLLGGGGDRRAWFGDRPALRNPSEAARRLDGRAEPLGGGDRPAGSALKSPAIEEALRPLHRLEVQAGEAHAAEIKLWQADQEAGSGVDGREGEGEGG